MVSVLLNLSAQVAKSSIYYCGYYTGSYLLITVPSFFTRPAVLMSFIWLVSSCRTLHFYRRTPTHGVYKRKATYILLIKITDAQNEVVNTYRRVRGLHFLAVIFADTILELKMIGISDINMGVIHY